MKSDKNNLSKMIQLSVLTIVLIQTLLSFPIINAESKIELAYDNGNSYKPTTWEAGPTYEAGLGVHFSTSNTLMLGINQTTVSRIRLYTLPHSFIWRIQDWNATTNQPGSTIIANGTATATHEGWLDIDVGLVNVSREFFVGIYNSSYPGAVTLFVDDSTNVGRSKVVLSSPPEENNNFLLRVIVELPVNLQDIIIKLEELDAKIGEPSSTVFSDLEEILSKLDLLLEKCGVAVGGTILPVRELKLVLDAMSDNLNTVIILALFGIAVTWIARKQAV